MPEGASSRRSTISASTTSLHESTEKLSFKDNEAIGGGLTSTTGANLRQRRNGGRLSLSSEGLKEHEERESSKIAGLGGARPGTGSGIGSRTSSKSSLSSSVDQPLPLPPSDSAIHTVVKPSLSAKMPVAPSKRSARVNGGDSANSAGIGSIEPELANSVRSESPIQHIDKPLSPRNGTSQQQDRDSHIVTRYAIGDGSERSVQPPLLISYRRFGW